MKTALKIVRFLLAGAAAAAFVSLIFYLSRLQTIRSIEKLTDYDDGYDLYRMNVKYNYCIENIINYGIKSDQDVVQAILKEALPMLPIKMEAPQFGCSAFTLTNVDGDVQMGRNYDFKNDTTAMLVYCTPKDGYKSVAFAAMDNVADNAPTASLKGRLASLAAPFVCLDGLNEKGVSIAILTLDSKPVRQNTGKPTIFTSLVVRLVLDRAATTQEAVNLLKGYDMFATGGRDYHFYITDASGDGRVVEYDCESETRELVDTPISAITNFYGLYLDKVLPNQKNGIYGHGRERYDAITKILEEQKGEYTNDTVWEALKAAAQEPNPADITSNTQWSIAYNNTALSAEIVIRRNWDDIYRERYKYCTNCITTYKLDKNLVTLHD